MILEDLLWFFKCKANTLKDIKILTSCFLCTSTNSFPLKKNIYIHSEKIGFESTVKTATAIAQYLQDKKKNHAEKYYIKEGLFFVK